MKRFLLNLTLLPETVSSWGQTVCTKASVEQKKRLSLSKLFSAVVMVLFMMGWSMLSMAQSSTYYSNGSYTVPPGVTTVTITGVGGAGGSGGQDCGNGCGYNAGAPGRYASQSFSVSQGASLSVYIGQQGGNGGSNTSGGGAGSGGYGYYYGGSGGRTGSSGNSGGGGGGGGATAVTGTGVLFVAGGGGGGGGRCNTANSGTAGSTSTGGSGSSTGGTGYNPGSSDGGGGGGGGGGVIGGSGGGLYSLNGEYAGYGGNSGSSSSGNSTSSSSPYVTISYTVSAGSISPSSQSICSGTQPSALTLTGYAGYIQWQYSANGSTFYNISGATSNTLSSAQMGTLTSTMYYRAVVSGSAYATTTVTVKALPTTPSSASCSSTTQSTASLSWGTSTAGDAITYYWVVGTSAGVTYGSGITQGQTSSTSVTATGLSANTTYYLKVYASTSCSISSYQTSAPFVTVPLAPGANDASLIRANSFTANWSASTGATSYFLDVATNPGFTSFVPGYQNKNVGNVTSYNLTGLNNNSNYYYRVRAINAGGASVNSNAISLKTLPVNNFLIEKVGGGDIGTQLAGQPFSIKITARDAENTTVTDYTGNATITTNSVLTSGGTTANFTAGILSAHSVTLTQAGISNKTLTASIVSPSVTSTSNPFTVDPAAIHEFTLVVDGTVTAGTPFTVTATVYDEYGNLKTNYDGANEVLWTTTATSSLNGTARIIPANGNQIFNHGVAANISGFTFYNSMEKPTITITDAPSSKPGTTAAITVLNAPLNNFKVVAGTSQISGIPFSATVTARDVYWNTCIDYTGNIYFNSSADYSAAGTISYSKEKQSFVGFNGVRTFSNLVTINPVGVYWISVTDEVSPGKSGQQQNIVVEPGAFEKLAIINSTSISTLEVDHTERVAGEDVVVTLTPRDAQGNLLYACRDISVLLNGTKFHLAGANNTSVPIVVNNLGNGSYTATVRMTKSGVNTISATYDNTNPIVTFDQTRDIYVTPAPTHHYTLNDPANIIAGGTRAAYTVSRYDVYNNLKTEGAETVYLTSTSDGANKGFYLEQTNGTAVQSITIANGDASANFWYYDEKAGNWTISASDATPENGATGIIDAIDVLTVNPAPVHHLALNAPDDITAGSVTRAAYTVTLQDVYNNTSAISGSATTVSLISSSTGTNKKFYTAASGGNTITQVSLAAGVSSANFWYYDEKAGDHTITARTVNMNDGIDEITVKPDLLKNFVVSGVSDPHDLGVLQSVTVEALDTYDNRKTDYVGTIMFGSSDLQAKKPAQYQFSEADKGVHTFNNQVEFSQPGEFYLKAWDIDESPKYGFQYNITVQRAVTVTANARTKTYGDALTLAATDFTVTGTNYTDVSGNSVSPVIAGDITGVTLSCSGTVATASVAGSPYAITPSVAIFKSGINSDYYHITYVDGTLTVNPKVLTITDPTIASREYNATKTAGAVTVGTLSGFVPDETVTATAVAADYSSANVGTYDNVVVNYTLANGTKGGLATNYSLATGTATGEITPKVLTITASTKNKFYGALLTNGAGSTAFTSVGLQNNETIGSVSVAYGTGAEASALPGTYTGSVTPSAATGGTFNADNYMVSYENGDIVVDKAVLTVTADAKSKTYDGSVYSPFTSTITGFVNGEKMADVVTGKVTYLGTAITAVNAGTYIITPVTTGLSAVNYSFVSANGSLRIYDEEIVDNTPPTWVTAPKALDRTVIYNDADGLTAAQALKPVASDANSFTLTKISGQFEKSSTCDLTGKYTNTWTAKDSYGNTSSVYTQVITIADLPNAKPLIAQVKDFSVYKNSKQVEVALSGIDPTSGCSLQEITSLVGVAENSSLITDVSVTYTKGSSTGTLLLTIADDTEGESIIRVTLKDNGGSENGGSDTSEMTFKVKVVSTDHGPKLLSEIPAQVINPGGKISIDLDDFFSSQDGNSISYTVTLADGSPLPSWMSYDPLTGIISGVAPQNESGSYLVTIAVTDIQGLTIKTNFWVVLTSSGTLVISGTVSSSTGYVTSGVQVVLLSVDANNKASVVGTRDLDATSSFAFSSLSSGSYLLKAVVTNAVKYPNLLNTYFNGSSSISTAQKIELASTNKTGVNLVMLPKMFGEGGGGSIAGLVVRKQGPVNEANAETGQIAPGVDVVLKQDGKIVDNTLTNLEGKYIFSSLPTGKYVVEAEQLGYTLNVVKKVTLNADTMVVENVNFILWTIGTIITDVKDLASGTVINMYPNPTSGQLHIVSNIDNSATVSVSTLTGKEVFRRNYLSGETINIDLSTQTSGLYMVTFESEGESVTRKIVLRK